MCSKKEYFDEFQGGKFVTVPIDCMSYCDVMVIEMVKIKMFDVMAYTLGDVAYVSKMCRNLISLSQLDSKGYNYSLVSGVLKVPCGSTILMEREKYDGLYYLIR
jgi:uncharacterized membrane protein HdeD (DUF308 family)